MVNVGGKPVSVRECVARGEVQMGASTLAQIVEGSLPKGDVFTTARIAGIQAAKRAFEWIPLAHPLPLDSVEVDLVPDEKGSRVRIEARVLATARTGVEMEALVAVSAAALTLYDMCKGVDRGMTLGSIRLVRKSGGKSGLWEHPEASGGS
jgi:cyclic pyranopterin phosphate synthase